MSRASQIIVLCEDRAHDIFVRRFLKKGWQIKPRMIRVLNYPHGKGTGKGFVEDNLAAEVKAYRTRSASTILIVVRDADENSVSQAKTMLDNQLESARQDNKAIVYIIPKWHIESWIAYLDGNEVDESIRYKNKYEKMAKSKKAHPLIDKLSSKCKTQEALTAPPPSLCAACEEFERIRNILSS